VVAIINKNVKNKINKINIVKIETFLVGYQV